MPKTALKKEKWTITFDPTLKKRVNQEAQKLHVYPVQLLEMLVREKLNPYGFQSVSDSIAYVNAIRETSRSKSDRHFLSEL
ncbi:MAG: hypothetical protein HYU99_00475 [Deltaproteobacteria bacterium]|nr:hypothetical protein [Deltaproteobacteria bacterium]